MSEWAKVHTDILGDPKLMRAARKGMKGLELTPWLIVFAKAAHDGGRLSVGGEPAEIADLLPLIPGATLQSVKTCLDNLEKLGILARELDGALRFPMWEARQTRPSEHPEAVKERVRQHRARRKPKKDTETVTSGNDGNESLQLDDCNAVEEKRREEKRGEGASATAPAAFAAGPYIDAFAEIRQGIAPAGIVARTCSQVEREVGQPETMHRWRRYLTERPHAPPAYFAQEHGRYAGPGPPGRNGQPPGAPSLQDEPNLEWVN